MPSFAYLECHIAAFSEECVAKLVNARVRRELQGSTIPMQQPLILA